MSDEQTMGRHPRPRGWQDVSPDRLEQMRKLNGTWGVYGMFPPRPFEIEWLLDQAARAERLAQTINTSNEALREMLRSAGHPDVPSLIRERDTLKDSLETLAAEKKDLCEHAATVLRPNIKLLQQRRDELQQEVQKTDRVLSNKILEQNELMRNMQDEIKRLRNLVVEVAFLEDNFMEFPRIARDVQACKAEL